MDKRTKRLLQRNQQEVQLAVIHNLLQNHRLPCPFCGGRVTYSQPFQDANGGWVINLDCPMCGQESHAVVQRTTILDASVKPSKCKGT